MRVARAPLRISLCGGGTDIPAFYEAHPYGRVVSFAINKYVYCITKDLPPLFPYKYKLSYSTTELCNEIDEIKHPIIREVLRGYSIPNLDLAVMADIPAGTGMGSSSSFTVALIKALNPHMGAAALAMEACAIELTILKEPIGKQDQYAAAFGSLREYTFTTKGVIGRRLPGGYTVAEHGLLFSTGGSRSASDILNGVVNQDTDALLCSILNTANKAAGSLHELHHLGAAITEGWEYKKQLSPIVSNDTIDRYIQLALQNGAYGAKLLGAGQSGFIFVLAPLDKHADIIANIGLIRVEFNIDMEGAKLL